MVKVEREFGELDEFKRVLFWTLKGKEKKKEITDIQFWFTLYRTSDRGIHYGISLWIVWRQWTRNFINHICL